MSKKPYEDLIEQKIRQEILKMPPQHDPCADALTLPRLIAEDQQKHVAFVREQQNKKILELMLKKQPSKKLKEIMARMSQKYYGIIRG